MNQCFRTWGQIFQVLSTRTLQITDFSLLTSQKKIVSIVSVGQSETKMFLKFSVNQKVAGGRFWVE